MWLTKRLYVLLILLSVGFIVAALAAGVALSQYTGGSPDNPWGNLTLCEENLDCPGGTGKYNLYCTSCGGGECHSHPSCVPPLNCADQGGDSWCQTQVRCPNDFSGCTIGRCAAGGNCYADCTACNGGGPTPPPDDGGGGGGGETQLCEDIPPSTATLSSPANGAEVGTTSPTVDWNPVASWGTNCSGATNSYEVLLDTSVTPNTSRCTTGQNTTDCRVSGLSQGGTYYWRVRANNGALTSTSDTWRFSVCADSAPSSPTLVSPTNGSRVTNSPVTLQWSHSGAWGTSCGGNNNRFRVYIGEGSPSTLVCDVPSGTTSCSVSVSNDTTYQWRVEASNGGVLPSSSPTWSFTTLFNVGGWFQMQDSYVLANQNIISKIPDPSLCVAPCTPVFNLDGAGGYPGVTAYAGSTADFGEGTVASPAWLANAGYAGRVYDYAYFLRLVPGGATKIKSDTISGSSLVSGFYTRKGDLTITDAVDVGSNTVVLFVSGNLTLAGNVSVTDGQGFFAAIVGGNTNIDPGVTSLEGLYLADGQISTGTLNPNPGDTTPDVQLSVRGSLVGWTAVSLERDLDPERTTGANNTTPAEFIQYAPDLTLNFPGELLRAGIVWREVAP